MKEYELTIQGIKHTIQLSDEDAKARGLKPEDAIQPVETVDSPLVPVTETSTEPGAETKAAKAPANKAASTDTK